MEIGNIIESFDKIVVWGAGYLFNKYLDLLPDYAYIIDNNSRLWGCNEQGDSILSPDILLHEESEKVLIIICSKNTDDIVRKLNTYGKYSYIDILSYSVLMTYGSHEDVCSLCNQESKYVLILAGIEARFHRNGQKKCIEEQLKIIWDSGFFTCEVSPLRCCSFHGKDLSYAFVCINGLFYGCYSLEQIVDYFRRVRSLIIHGLYYNYEYMERLISRITVEKKIVYYIHDYSCLCDCQFLFYNDHSCIRDDSLICDSCTHYIDTINHRKLHEKLFSRCNVIICPSADVKNRIESIYQSINCIVIPHLVYDVRYVLKDTTDDIKVAFCGVGNKLKGWHKFVEIVDTYTKDYRWFSFGETFDAVKKNIKTIGVEINKDTVFTMAEALVKYDIDIVVFPTLCPETYGYTYYESLESACFPVTTIQSGNIAYDIHDANYGVVFDTNEDLVRWFGDKRRVVRELSSPRKKIFNVRTNDAFMEYV